MVPLLAPRFGAPAAQPRDSRNATLLIVEDEPDVRTSLRSLLQTAWPHARVLTAESGPDALDLVAAERVDLLVADFRMPGMNGLDLLRRARGLRPRLRCLLVTAYPSLAGPAALTQDLHVDRLLIKPFDPEALLRSVDDLMPTSDDTALGNGHA